jgi:hypothetical protein
VVQAVAAPASSLQVWLAIATLSEAVIVAVWLAVEFVGVVSPVIATVGSVWSTTIVAVCVVLFPTVSVATTVMVWLPAAMEPVAKEVVQAVAAPASSLQV